MTKGTQRHNIFSSKLIVWDDGKNEWLKRTRGVSFETAREKLIDGRILAFYDHENQWKYPGQQIVIIEIEGYAYMIPFMETSSELLLKTIIPSRKSTAKYLKEMKIDEAI